MINLIYPCSSSESIYIELKSQEDELQTSCFEQWLVSFMLNAEEKGIEFKKIDRDKAQIRIKGE